MPVQIKVGNDSTDPRVISLGEYEAGRANFSLHYYYTHLQAAFGGDVIEVPWHDLEDAVESYMLTASVAESEVALRFVHCFDTVSEELYLRVQLCRMVPSPSPVPPYASAIYDLNTTNAQWYEIKGGAFSPTTDTALADTAYLQNFYYKEEPQAITMQQLSQAPTKYVKNLTFPWQSELKLMYTENESPVDATINFAACSYIEPPAASNVMWPHGLVIFLADSDGNPMLDNGNYATIFHNKGADMATQCPPNCGVYITPNM